MKLGRRGFLTGALATTTGLAGCVSENVGEDRSLITRRSPNNAFGNWTLHERNSTADYAYSVVPDFTGTASSSELERFELRDGDCGGVDCQTDRQRYERMDLGGEMNQRASYSISFFLPRNQSIGGPHTTIFAFFEKGAPNVSLNVIVMGWRESVSWLYAEYGTATGRKKVRLAKSSDIFGRWNTIDLDVHWANEGFYKAKLNGQTVLDVNTKTMFGTDRNLNIFHYGLYMGGVSRYEREIGSVPTRTIYFSKVEKYI